MTNVRPAREDFFQAISREFRELAASPPSEQGLERIREGLASKYQGVQHLAVRALAAWIDRARPLRPRRKGKPRRPRVRPDGIPEGPAAEWIALLVQWIVLLPFPWRQSVSFSSRLVARLARPEDIVWILDLYLTMGRAFHRALVVLPPEVCVPRLEALSTEASNPDDRDLANYVLRVFEARRKLQLGEGLGAGQPEALFFRLPVVVRHGHGRRGRRRS